MENSVISLLNNAIEAGMITDTALLLLIIGFLAFIYRTILRPIVDRVNNVPTYNDVQKIIEDQKSNDSINLDELKSRLEKIVEYLELIEADSNISTRDIQDLKRDLDNIKQILNQFQGHLMYNNGGRGHWGNKELK